MWNLTSFILLSGFSNGCMIIVLQAPVSLCLCLLSLVSAFVSSSNDAAILIQRPSPCHMILWLIGKSFLISSSLSRADSPWKVDCNEPPLCSVSCPHGALSQACSVQLTLRKSQHSMFFFL